MDNLFLTVLTISLTTSVVIVAVIMLGSLINKRYAAKWKYWLWIVLALRLLIPFNYKLPDVQFQIQIPAEVGNMEVTDILGLGYPTTEEQFTEPQTAEVIYTKPQTVDLQAIQPDIQKESQLSFTLLQALGYLWAAGTICLLLWQLAGFFCYKRRILRSGKAVRNPNLLAQLRELSNELGIRKNIAFMIYEKADSPMVIGFWHPVLVLPKEDYTRDESFYILRHELIHLRRNDVLVKFLLLFARDFHWFNPVIYLMHREAVVDMELACDEAVVSGSSFDQREVYTETLMSTLNSQQRKGSMLSTQFSGGKRVIKKRFRNILSNSKKKNGVILFSVIIALTVAIGTLANLVVEAAATDRIDEEAIPDLNVIEVNDVPVKEDADVKITGNPTTVLTLIKEGSQYDTELINGGISDNGHNIYTGYLGNEEIRMLITRTGDSLYASYITRSGEGKVFQGNLEKNAAGFVLNTDDGGYLNGIITKTDEGYFIISGDGVLSQNRVTFTLYQESFITMGDDLENYYDFFGYNAKEAEQFAQQIKDSAGNKTAFARLIQYPIYIEMDGSQIMIENEKGMIDIYDRLMEQNGFRQQIENIFTKYMFVNYYGVCIEDGIMWFSKVGPEDYKITAINRPQTSQISNGTPSSGSEEYINQELENLMTLFYTAYFNKDIDTIRQYLAESYQGGVSVVGNEINSLEDIEILEIKGWKNAMNKDNTGDECELSLEFKFPNEDSYTYLTVGFIKEDSGWKIKGYGLEK